jgi:hypothetical protein
MAPPYLGFALLPQAGAVHEPKTASLGRIPEKAMHVWATDVPGAPLSGYSRGEGAKGFRSIVSAIAW